MKNKLFLFLVSLLCIAGGMQSRAQIVGPTSICVATTTALGDLSGGGFWSSGNPAVATVGSTSGVVTGVSVGTAMITFAMNSGARDYAVVSVNAPITTGQNTVCVGSTTTLINSTPGGLWGTSNTGVASINCSQGVVKGLTAGTTIITYTVGTGCFATTTVTVIQLTPNTGMPQVCTGLTTTLANAIPGGRWISTNPSVATIGSASGVVTGIVPGNSLMTYTFGPGCQITTGITVISLGANFGPDSVCVGLFTPLNNVTLGGNWSTSDPTVATVFPLTGVVLGQAAGTAIITYSFGTSCKSMTTVKVTDNPAIVTVTGGGTYCTSTTISASGGAGGTIYFQGTTLNGTSTASSSTTQTITKSGTYYFRSRSASGCWGPQAGVSVLIPEIIGPNTNCLGSITVLVVSGGAGFYGSSAPSVATVGAGTGVVNGVSVGTVMITNTTPGGCFLTHTMTVVASPPVITGPTSVCLGKTIQLSNAGAGGTWSSSAPTIATIGATTGIVTGTASGYGTTAITYTMGGMCRSIVTINVNPLAPISVIGTNTVCVAQTLPLTDLVAGGTWSTATTTYATINATSGVVTGITPGTTIVSYLLPGGCLSTTSVTVKILSPITGPSSVCVGQTITMNDTTQGGNWYSLNPTQASIGIGNGIVTGVKAPFNVQLSYTLGTGCQTTTTITVNPRMPIGGVLNVCQGLTTTLIDSVSGGTWASATPAIATINSAGVVTGVAAGIDNITYTTPAGCITTNSVIVNPVAPITGPSTVCFGRVMLLSNSIGHGTWSSSAATTATVGLNTGIVTGIAGAHTATITYTFCTGCTTTTVITVNPLNPITGPTSVCVGQTSTLLNINPGGTWSAGSTALADFSTPTVGIVSGISAGTTVVSYTLPTGCIATASLTVNPLSVITGPSTVCVGQTMTLSDATPGGVWSSGAPSTASIGASTGIVTGVTGNVNATISYTMASGCRATKIVSVNPLAPILGAVSVCEGQSITLTDAVTGGTWSSASSLVSVAPTTGAVTGVTAGAALISYVTSTGCVATATRTINPLATIAGPSSVCKGQTITLTDATPGGTWSSAAASTASVIATTGIVTGVGSGLSTTVTYTTPKACKTTALISVLAREVITGPVSVCEGQSITLLNSVAGGTWSSASGLVSVASSTGVVSGITSGAALISYVLPTGCTTIITRTINPLAAIVGTSSVCKGQTITLTNATTGGTWSSGAASTASVIPATGVVTGVTGGLTATITYTTPLGCKKTAILSVNAREPITGAVSVCVGQSVTLLNSILGGTWSSASGLVSVVSGTGVVSGVTAGVADISYILPTGCTSTITRTVNALVAITGPSSVCVGQTITLADAIPGGTWTSGLVSTASVIAATGVVTGVVGGGSVNITYTTPLGCKTSTSIMVNPLAVITGPVAVCQGQTITLGDIVSGGTWSADGSGNASVGTPTSGVITGVNTGTATISYILPTGCTKTTRITINALAAIGGISSVCPGISITLTNAVAGGAWTSSTPSVATIVSTTGVLRGVSGGVGGLTTNITYTLPSGCKAMGTVTVKPAATTAPITGLAAVSISGGPITLADAVTGGVWTSSNTAKATVVAGTGVVTGVSTGAVTITYTVTNSYGCIAYVTKNLTVGATPPPVVAIGGTVTLAAGTMVLLTSEVAGGVWSSADGEGIFTVDAENGLVSGLNIGRATVNYTYTDNYGEHTIATKVIVSSSTLGNSVITTGGGVSIAPNPTKGDFTIKGTLGTDINEATIELTDMLGHIVYTNKISVKEGNINERVLLNNMASGMYILNLRSNEENRVFHFVIE